jgi:hypothetical protein
VQVDQLAGAGLPRAWPESPALLTTTLSNLDLFAGPWPEYPSLSLPPSMAAVMVVAASR